MTIVFNFDLCYTVIRVNMSLKGLVLNVASFYSSKLRKLDGNIVSYIIFQHLQIGKNHKKHTHRPKRVSNRDQFSRRTILSVLDQSFPCNKPMAAEQYGSIIHKQSQMAHSSSSHLTLSVITRHKYSD